jgi:Na+/proline symporter
MMIGSTVLVVEAMSTDQAILQKYFTTKSKFEPSKSLVFYGFFIIVFSTLLSVLGVLLFVFYVHHPALRASLHNPDAVVPHYAAAMLPHGLAGLLVASIFAGSMSTVSASLNSLETSSVMDIYKRLIRGERSERHYIFASRAATGLWGLFATAAAFLAGRLGPLGIAFAKIESLIGGVMLGIFLLGILSKRATGTGVLWGATLGFASVIYVAWYTSVGFYWCCVLGCLSMVIAGWLCSIWVSRAPRELS